MPRDNFSDSRQDAAAFRLITWYIIFSVNYFPLSLCQIGDSYQNENFFLWIEAKLDVPFSMQRYHCNRGAEPVEGWGEARRSGGRSFLVIKKEAEAIQPSRLS